MKEEREVFHRVRAHRVGGDIRQRRSLHFLVKAAVRAIPFPDGVSSLLKAAQAGGEQKQEQA